MKDKRSELSELTEYEKYRAAVAKAESFYRAILVICGIMMAGGICFAVVSDVFMGLLISIAAVLVYMALTSNMLYRLLGLSYRGSTGKMSIVELYGKGREEIWIPQRLMMLEVSEICDEAFDHSSSALLEAVHLPATVCMIGKDVFKGCESLRTVYFGGSREQWEAIESETDMSGYEIIFGDSSTQISKPEKKSKKNKKDKKSDKTEAPHNAEKECGDAPIREQGEESEL